MEHKSGSGWLRKAFQKAVISGMLVASIAGIATPAFAQNHTPQGNTVSVTQTVTQNQNVKPWANDPTYVQSIQLQQEASNLRLEQLHMRLENARANMNDWLARSGNAQHRWTKAVGRDGLSFGEIAQTATGANKILVRYNTTMRTYDIQEAQAQNREKQHMNNYVVRLDAQYARQPHYAQMLRDQAAARTASVSGTQVVTASPTNR